MTEEHKWTRAPDPGYDVLSPFESDPEVVNLSMTKDTIANCDPDSKFVVIRTEEVWSVSPGFEEVENIVTITRSVRRLSDEENAQLYSHLQAEEIAYQALTAIIK